MDAEYIPIYEAGEFLATGFAGHHILRLSEPLQPRKNIREIKLCFRDTSGDINRVMTGMK